MLCLKCEFACMMELLSFQRGELQDSLYEFGAARKRGRGKSQVRAVVISLNQKWKQKTTEQLTVTSVFQWLLCLQNAHRLQAEVEMQHQCWVHALTHQHPVQSWGTRPQPGLQQCGMPPLSCLTNEVPFPLLTSILQQWWSLGSTDVSLFPQSHEVLQEKRNHRLMPWEKFPN